jgi:hypothetical protein
MDQQATVITTMLSEQYLVSALEESVWCRRLVVPARRQHSFDVFFDWAAAGKLSLEGPVFT